jgi:hypothetical protein
MSDIFPLGRRNVFASHYALQSSSNLSLSSRFLVASPLNVLTPAVKAGAPPGDDSINLSCPGISARILAAQPKKGGQRRWQ